LNPLVSVLMLAYNAKKYIHEVIESVINQNWDMYALVRYLKAIRFKYIEKSWK